MGHFILWEGKIKILMYISLFYLYENHLLFLPCIYHKYMFVFCFS